MQFVKKKKKYYTQMNISVLINHTGAECKPHTVSNRS